MIADLAKCNEFADQSMQHVLRRAGDQLSERSFLACTNFNDNAVTPVIGKARCWESHRAEEERDITNTAASSLSSTPVTCVPNIPSGHQGETEISTGTQPRQEFCEELNRDCPGTGTRTEEKALRPQMVVRAHSAGRKA